MLFKKKFHGNMQKSNRYVHICTRRARGVMVIVGGYGHGDTSSNPGRD